MYVSFDAQYQFILAQKGARGASLIEAAMLDAGMVILSALGIGLARAGKPSGSVRVLIMICAGASAGMNFAAADPGATGGPWSRTCRPRCSSRSSPTG